MEHESELAVEIIALTQKNTDLMDENKSLKQSQCDIKPVTVPSLPVDTSGKFSSHPFDSQSHGKHTVTKNSGAVNTSPSARDINVNLMWSDILAGFTGHLRTFLPPNKQVDFYSTKMSLTGDSLTFLFHLRLILCSLQLMTMLHVLNWRCLML